MRLFRKNKGNVLCNNALNTLYLLLYGIGHTVKDHSESEPGYLLLPLCVLLFLISSKGSLTRERDVALC